MTVALFAFSLFLFILGQVCWLADRHMHDSVLPEQFEANKKYFEEHQEDFK